MAVRIQIRRDTSANWTSNNPVLYPGEIGVETDTKKFKIGPVPEAPAVATAWNSITAYANVVPSDLSNTLGDYILAADLGVADGPAKLNIDGNLLIPEDSIIFEGATANDFETTLTVADPTADRTITFPDATGTVVLADSTNTLTNKTLTSPIVSGLSLSDGSIVFEGATANDHETTLTVTDPTGDRTITFPDATGTVITTGNLNNINEFGVLVSPIVMEGSTANDFELTISAGDPTADRTVTFPDVTGTVVTTGDTGSVTNTMLAGSIANEKLSNSAITINGTSTSLGGSRTLGTDDVSEGSTNKYYTDERAQDAIATAIAAGTHTNITITYDDDNNKFTFVGANTYSDENAQDAVGNAVGNGLDYNDETGAISVDPSEFALSAVGAPTANVAMATYKITGLGTPTESADAATKQYVDNTASGIVAKPQVLGATTANIDATYNNGTAGVGATLTHNTNGVFPSSAGGATGWSVGKGILVKNQTNKAQNGRYFVSDMGSVSTPYVLTRCSFCDEASEIPGAYIYVQAGTNAGTGWIQVVADPATFVVGTDNIDVYQFSGSGTYTAGTGLTLTGNEYSINTSVTADLSTAQTLTNKTLTSPKINEDVAVTATATELNILDGVTSTTAELNILDGVTSTTAELNILDGVTSTTAELNILDGVTSSTAELNILDGVTSTAAEINLLDGVTATTTELNYVDGVTSAIQTQLDGKVDESLFDTKGDILVASADNTPAKLAAGTNGYLLTANSSATNGIEWAAAPVSLPDQTGNSGEYLTTDGTNASWAAIPVTSAAAPTSLGTVFGRTDVADGNENVSLGRAANSNATPGSGNVAIGTDALRYSNNSSNIVAVGKLAAGGEGVNIGFGSVAVGYSALSQASGEGNISIGRFSGAGITTGQNNTIVGNIAGYTDTNNLSSGSNNILIGNRAETSSSSVSNEITLGNSSINRFRVPGLGIDWTTAPIVRGSATITANTATTIDTNALDAFTSAEYVVSLKQGSKVRTSKVIVQTDGTSVDMTEFAITETGGVMSGVVISAAVSSTNGVLQLTVTDATSTNVTVKFSKVKL
jgi:hypothetical protein